MKDTNSAIGKLVRAIDELQEKPPSIREAVRTDELFSALAENIEIALQGANYIEQLNLVRDISKKFVEVRALESLAPDILNGANQLIPFTDGAIGLVDEGIIRFPYAIGINSDSVMDYKILVGEGLTGWVVKHRKSLNIGDTSKDERYVRQISDTNSELDVPIVYGAECLGVINVESKDFHAFSDKDMYLLENLADAAAIAIKNVQFLEQIKARTRIVEQLTSTLEYTSVLRLILDAIFNLIKCREASVGIVSDVDNEIQFTIASGPSKREVEEFRISIEKGLTGWAVRNNQSVRVDDVRKDDRYEPQIQTTLSELDVPLVFGGKVIGVLNVESPNVAAFTDEDQNVLEDMAPYAALALRNAEIYKDIRERLEIENQLRGFSESRAIIGDVSGNIVHDVNAAIGLIRLSAKEIIEDSSKNLISQEVHKIIQQAEKVSNLIHDFQNRRDSFLVSPSPLDVNKTIVNAIKEAEIPSTIEVVTMLNKNLPLTFAAEEQLKKVFLNLINNSVAAMPEGGSLWFESSLRGNSIFVRVKDTGIGISKEDQSHIFDGVSKNDRRQGLGFGLSWSRLYIKSLQGDIDLEHSEIGEGAIFVVILPIYKGELIIKEERN